MPLDNEYVIAPYWTDFDTTKSGNVYFKESFDVKVLNKISTEVKRFDKRMTEFTSHWAFIATWENVHRIGGNYSEVFIHIIVGIYTTEYSTYMLVCCGSTVH